MITKQQIYALKLMKALAANPGEVVRREDLCKQEGVPASFAGPTLRKLKENGLIQIKQGNSGGPVLFEDPAEISVLDVIVAIGGPLRFNEGVDGVIGYILRKAQAQAEEFLELFKIDELEDDR